MIYKIIKLAFIVVFFANISACTYKKPLANHELIVPPFIQEENKDLYEIFKAID
jgi:hypothetical protein